jgi:hypothetical protein
MEAPNGKYELRAYSEVSTAKPTVKKVDNPLSLGALGKIELSVRVRSILS